MLLGEHDFTAFAAADNRDKEFSRVRCIFHSAITRNGNLLVYQVTGSGFLKHMVRNLMGAVMEAGKGNLSPDDIRALLTTGRGVKCGHSMPAKGLHLISVEYGSGEPTALCSPPSAPRR